MANRATPDEAPPVVPHVAASKTTSAPFDNAPVQAVAASTLRRRSIAAITAARGMAAVSSTALLPVARVEHIVAPRLLTRDRPTL
jgi:hypothetical protein